MISQYCSVRESLIKYYLIYHPALLPFAPNRVGPNVPINALVDSSHVSCMNYGIGIQTLLSGSHLILLTTCLPGRRRGSQKDVS